MSILKEKTLPLLLQQQQDKSWQQFSDQYGDAVKSLSSLQLKDFKQAITLSDFILSSALQAPDTVLSLFSSETVYKTHTPDYKMLLQEQLKQCTTEDDLHRILRIFRLQQMVNIAVADLVLNISLDESLCRLSELADQLILGALGWLTDFCQHKWGTPKNKEGEIMPLLVYGMGKLGGKELNFSSDIDLIFVYPNRGETEGLRRNIDNQQFFIRLGQKLITALNQKTADGFVYRVDMRLRPFGESGPLVMTFDAMEDYYQEQGRDWERYAMLKSRLIGEGKYHHKLSKMLRPFVYRRYIDFSVIDSLRRMKMMIAQEVRRKGLTNNIKLGAGGIREIEFIVQVFQLIRGGRVNTLQERNLLSVLPILVAEEELSQHSMLVLKHAYRFLRRVENIIQALHDQQTQTLPDLLLDQARILHILQNEHCSTWSNFLEYLSFHTQGVHQEFIVLIGEQSPNHQSKDQHWQTLWDSKWDDEESCHWIQQSNHSWQVDKIWSLLSSFRTDSAKRSIGSRGRHVLDKLIPLLLCHLNEQNVEEVVLERVLLIFNKILTRTAYLELLFENEGALKHLIKLCRASSWVTDHIAKYPILLDELIDPKLLNNPPALSSYKKDLREVMLRIPEEDLEAQMDMLRQFKQAQQLRIAAADISNILPLTKVSDHLTALAEAIIEEVINLAWQHVKQRFGLPELLVDQEHKGFSVLGYGKMGGIELAYTSDLDLVFLHNSQPNEMTNGSKSIPASQFYAKLAQRIMHIFNTRMSSGILYELDMRLRPSGNSGLLVVHINTFNQYQLEDAWVWEHQALVRARCVYGNDRLIAQFNDIRRNILSQKREGRALHDEVIKMRDKMRAHLDQSNEGYSDIKQGFGGLVDIEFLAQYLVLKHSFSQPEVCRYSDNIRIFQQLHLHDIINEQQKIILTDYYCQLRDLGHKAALQNKEQILPNETFASYATKINNIVAALYQVSD
ncbi:MAG: glutamate-ammonia-ligase adenylyltransferase [Alteromonadaceae bacterium]|jgi:glutamate-ammonia-ligase adenylyltransferase